jgi:hypothetical protein
MRDLFATPVDGAEEPRFRGIRMSEVDRKILERAFAAGDEGCILDDFCDATGKDKVSVSPRMRRLCDDRLLRDTSRSRICREGKEQTVWVLETDPIAPSPPKQTGKIRQHRKMA